MHKQNPMSHRIIEKRRRDRMNSCLADLSQLIPRSYVKKFQGRGRMEKTEIIELAIKHLKHLQSHSCIDPDRDGTIKEFDEDRRLQAYQLGFQESMTECVRFLVEVEGHYANKGICGKLVNHLQDHYEKAAREFRYKDIIVKEEYVGVQNGLTKMEINSPDMVQFVDVTKREQLDFDGDLRPADHPSYNQFIKSRLSELLQKSESFRNIPNDEENKEQPHLVKIANDTFSSTTTAANKTGEVYKLKNYFKERFCETLYHAPTMVIGESSAASIVKESDFLTYSTLQSHADRNETTYTPFQNHVPSIGSQNNVERMKGIAFEPTTFNKAQFNTCKVNNETQSNNGSTSGYSTGGETTDDTRYKNQVSSEQRSPQSSDEENCDRSVPLCVSSVPIFALHPKGTFYVPLTLDSEVLGSIFGNVEENVKYLHPVNISVNFFGPEMKVKKWNSDSKFHHHNQYHKRCDSST